MLTAFNSSWAFFTRWAGGVAVCTRTPLAGAVISAAAFDVSTSQTTSPADT